MYIQLVQLGHRQPVHHLDLPPQPVQGLLRVLLPQRRRLRVGHQHKVVRQQRMVLGDVVLAGILGPGLANVDSQRVLDAEDGVGGFVRVIAKIERPISSACIPHPAKRAATHVIK
jgi:hypothetical protein